MQIGPYTLSNRDRARGVYVIGGSGSGKSTLLADMVLQDIHAGHGLCFIDPPGDTAREILDRIPESRAGDAIYLNPADKKFAPALNPFDAPYTDTSSNADNIVAIWRARFGKSWGPSLERLFLFSTMALVECQDATVLSIPKLFHNESYRRYVLKTVTNPLMLAFWREEFPTWTDRMLDQRLDPVLNKVERTLMHPAIMTILGQPRGKLNMRTIMDEPKS
jgi:Type IV secretion-system coupling protein DNA-binding domain